MTVTRTRRHWFQLLVLASLLLFQRLNVTATEHTAEDIEEKQEEEDLYVVMDSILADITSKYDSIKTDDFWHPYDFGTGNDNREVINVVGVTEHQIPGKFIQWRSSQLGLQQKIVGLKENSIEIYDSQLLRTTAKDFPFTLSTMEVFTRWDAENLTPFMVIAVATATPHILILTMSNLNDLRELGTFPVSSKVQSVMVSRVDKTEKLVLVPSTSSNSISIYSLDVSQEEAQLWFFQRISRRGFDSVMVHQPDTVDSVLLISRGNELNIYQFDSTMHHYKVSNTLTLPNKCNGMLTFTMMYQHYVSCTSQGAANEVQFISYNFNTNEYEKSSLKKANASEVVPIALSGSRGDTIFLTQDIAKKEDDSMLNTLIFDGQKSFKTGKVNCATESCKKLTTFTQGTSFEYQDNNALVFPTPPTEDSALVLMFITDVTSTPSPAFTQSKRFFEEFKVLSRRMSTWKDRVSKADDVLKRALNTDGNNTLTGMWTIKSITTEDAEVKGREGRAPVVSDEIFEVLKFGDVDWTEADFKSTNAQIQSHMETMQSNMTFISREMNKALLKTSNQVQVVSSKMTMQGTILAENAEFKNLNVKTIGGTDAAEYFQSLAHKRKVLEIPGGLAFASPLNVSHVHTKEINKILVDDIALLNENNVFNCHSTFETVRSARNVLVTNVNGHDLANSVVMANNVSGLHFMDGIVAYQGAESTTQFPFNSVMLISEPQIVESPIVFSSVKVHGPMSVNNLNGKIFNAFTNSIITKDYKGNIDGEKTFVGSVNLNSLSTKKWNELSFPEDFFLTSVDSIVLNGENNFTRLAASKVSVAKEINGIDTRDLVSLTEADVFSNSVWIFNGDTKIFKDIVVDNTVDGILMESLPHEGIIGSDTADINPNADTIVFKQPIHIEDLTIASTINDEHFENIFGNMILFDGTECSVPGHTKINGASTFTNIELHDKKINNFLTENFLTRDTSQTISKKVTMSGGVFFEEFHALDKIDGASVNNILQKAIRVSKDTNAEGAVIPYDVHFKSIECKESLTINGPINNLPAFAHAVALRKGNASQVIKSPIQSTNPTFSDLELKSLEISPGKTLQSLDVNTWNTTRVKLSEPAVFSKPFTVNKMTVHGNLDTANINGIDVEDLKSNVLRSDGKSQRFLGRVVMTKGLSVHNGAIQFHQTVDGFSLDELIAHGFPVDAKNEDPIVIRNDWEFQSLKVHKGMQINDDVCGVSLNALEMDSVKKNDNAVEILGSKSFDESVDITRSLTSPQINGKNLKNLFLLDVDQVVEAHPTFTSVMFKDVLDADSVNSINTKWLSEKYSFGNGQHVIVDHNVITKHPMKAGSMTVGGKTQNIVLGDFMAKAIQVEDHGIEFKDAVEMTQPTEVHKGINTVLYNGLNFDDLSTRTVQLDKSITLKQPLTFTEPIHADEVVVKGDLTASNSTNGINWTDLQRKAIKLNTPGKEINMKRGHFQNLVTTKGVNVSSLNGKPFDDFVTLSTPQNLENLKFGEVSLESSKVNIGGTVDSRDISHEFADTLMSNTVTPQSLPGKTVFNGHVQAKQNVSCYGKSLQRNVVTTSDALELEPVVFTSPIVVENNIQLKKPIGGHNMSSIFSGAFMTNAVNKSQIISSSWQFKGPVTFLHSVSGKGVEDSINIQALMQEKNQEILSAAQKIDEQKQRFIGKCNALHQYRNILAENPVKLDSFDSHQVISLKNEATNVLAIESNNNHDVMLFVQNSNCEVSRYHWQRSNELFHNVVESSPLNIGKVKDWQAVPLKEGGSVVVFSKSISDCSSRELGLSSIFIAPNGQPSSVVNILDDIPVKSFKVVRNPETSETWLFNLVSSTSSSKVQVFTWQQKEFVFKRDFMQVNATMERLEVTAVGGGFGLMCHNDNAVMMYTISTDDTEGVIASRSLLTSTSGTMAVFENFGTLYALLPEAGTVSSISQPTCNFQMIRMKEESIEVVQKLQVPEVVSASLFSFSNKKFLTFMSKSHGLSLYKFMGLNGFNEVNTPYKTFDGFILKSFSIKRSGHDEAQPFLLMLSKNTIKIFRSKVFGDTLHTDFAALCNK